MNIDLSNLDIDINTLTEDEKYELFEILTKLEESRKYEDSYYKSLGFKPYDFQKDFYAAGKRYKSRFLCAANRVGKSFSEAMEFAYHATGLYPEDYEGHRFVKSEMVMGDDIPNPHDLIMWAVGITGDSTRKVMQKELFGTASARMDSELGTGAIPRHCINLDTLERDGNRILIAQIKHHDPDGNFDGWTTVEFRSTQQGESALMGSTVDYIWFDEESPYNSLALYEQALTRTTTTKGKIVITATPENGLTPLVKMFMQDQSGELYFQNATWDDVSHISDEDKRIMLASIPKWKHDLRTKGIPVLGEGMVYSTECPLDDILCEPFEIPESWRKVCGIDVGYTHDTAVVWSAYDSNTDTIYVYDCYSAAGGTPSLHSHAIRSRGDWIPVVLPHDADNTERGSGQSVAHFYRQAGVNTLTETFYNPLDLTGGAMNNFVMIGIQDILQRMNTGRFKIFKTGNTKPLMNEIMTYQFKDGKIKKIDDDLVDAMRYSAMSVVFRGKSKEQHDSEQMLSFFNNSNGYGNYDDQYSNW